MVSVSFPWDHYLSTLRQFSMTDISFSEITSFSDVTWQFEIYRRDILRAASWDLIFDPWLEHFLWFCVDLTGMKTVLLFGASITWVWRLAPTWGSTDCWFRLTHLQQRLSSLSRGVSGLYRVSRVCLWRVHRDAWWKIIILRFLELLFWLAKCCWQGCFWWRSSWRLVWVSRFF